MERVAKTIMEGTVEGARRRGRQHKTWAGNLEEMDSHVNTRAQTNDI